MSGKGPQYVTLGGASRLDPGRRWPGGINPRTDRFRIRNGQCRRCFSLQHSSQSCPVPKNEQGAYRALELLTYGIVVGSEEALALITDEESTSTVSETAPNHNLTMREPLISETIGLVNASEDVKATSARDGRKSAHFILGSTGGYHLTHRRDLLSDYQDLAEPIVMVGAFRSQAKGLGIGTLNLRIGDRTIVLDNVLYLPDVRSNILSDAAMVKAGWTIHQNPEPMSTVVFDAAGNEVLQFTLQDQLMSLDADVVLRESPRPTSNGFAPVDYF